MGQYPGVQHVGVGDDDMARLPDRLPGAHRGVAVVGIGLEVDLHLPHEAMQLGQLVLGQRLGGKEIQRASFRIAQHRLQNWQVIAGGLPGRRRRHHHHVFPGQCEAGRLRLMGIEAADATRRQRLPQAQLQPIRKARVASLAGRHGVIEG